MKTKVLVELSHSDRDTLENLTNRWKETLESDWRKYKGWKKLFEFAKSQVGGDTFLKIYEKVISESEGKEALISVM